MAGDERFLRDLQLGVQAADLVGLRLESCFVHARRRGPAIEEEHATRASARSPWVTGATCMAIIRASPSNATAMARVKVGTCCSTARASASRSSSDVPSQPAHHDR